MDSRNVTQYSLVAAKEKESSCYISAVVAGMPNDIFIMKSLHLVRFNESLPMQWLINFVITIMQKTILEAYDIDLNPHTKNPSYSKTPPARCKYSPYNH